MRLKRCLLVLLVSISACVSQPNTPAKTLASTEIALTAAVQTSDQMLNTACTDAKSDLCGTALRWHASFIGVARTAETSIVTARTQMASSKPEEANNALASANAVIQQLNHTIQAGVK